MKSVAAVPVSVRPVKVRAAAPLLLTVTVCAALVLPSVCDEKLKVAALSEIAGCAVAVPVPLSVTLLGEPVALWVIDRLALRAPLTVGVKASFTTHDALAATLPPAVQVVPVAIWNSPACAPESARALMVSGALPLLLTVTVCAVEVVAMVWVKLSVVGDTPITGLSATPVPESAVLLWAPLASCVTSRLALRAPAADGVKPMITVQLPAATTEPPAVQVPPLMVNSVLPVPSVPSVRVAVPVFDKVAVCAVLAVPTLTLPNASELVSDARGAAAAVAVALRLTLPGLPAALCVIESCPVRAPVVPAAGLKATETVQFAPAATLPPAAQVPPATMKSAVLLNVIADSASAAVPVLLTVTFCAALVAPMAVDANVSVAGVMLATGAGVTVPEPVPLNAMVIGVSVVAWVRLSVPVRAPAAVGVNDTITLQVVPTGTAVPQVPPVRAKSPEVATLRALMA